MIRKQSFHSRGNRIEIGVFCFLKIDIGKKLFHLRSKRYLAQNYVLSKSFFARFALQPLIVNNFYGFEFGFSEPEKEQNEQGVRTLDISVSLTVVDEPNFFVLGERLPAFGLIGRQNDFFHGRGDIVILCCHVENTVQHKSKFFRFAMFVFAYGAAKEKEVN